VKVGGEERMRLMCVARQEVGWSRERQRVMYLMGIRGWNRG